MEGFAEDSSLVNDYYEKKKTAKISLVFVKRKPIRFSGVHIYRNILLFYD